MPLGYVIPQHEIVIHDSKGRLVQHLSAKERARREAKVSKDVKRELEKQKR